MKPSNMIKHTVDSVLQGTDLNDERKAALIEAMNKHETNPRKLDKAFEGLLVDIKWSWPWLDQFPDTLDLVGERWTKNPLKAKARLLAHVLLCLEPLQGRLLQWEHAAKSRPFAIVKRVGDNNDFAECISAAETVLEFDQLDASLLPLHRPGCRCYLITARAKDLARYLG